MLQIEEWSETHLRWSELENLIWELEQLRWVQARADWHLSSHLYAAMDDNRVVGFLRYIVQAIGVDEDLPPLVLDGQELLEAKVLAFGVLPQERRRGIGRALQERLIVDCRAWGLYQIRSYSSNTHTANHMLKASLGFGIHPLPAGGGKEGYYFVLPLKR